MRITLMTIMAACLLAIPSMQGQKGILKGVLKDTGNKIKYGTQRMLVNKASDMLARAVIRRAEKEIDKVLREAFEKEQAEAKERGEEPKHRDYGGFLKALNKAADVPVSYSFDLQMHCTITARKEEPQNVIYQFSREGGFFGFESEAEGNKSLMVVDLDKDIIIMYINENGKKTATALPGMMSLGSTLAKKEIEEVNKSMGSINATGKEKTVATYNCKEYEMIYEKEKALSYVTTGLDFSWPQAFGAMLKKFMPESGKLPAEVFEGMALESITFDKKGREDTRWTTNKVSKEKVVINNSEWNFENFAASADDE